MKWPPLSKRYRLRPPSRSYSAGNAVVVVKAQIHAGGRGKAGGVKLARTIEEADAPPQRPSSACNLSRTRPARQDPKVQRLLIEQGSAIDRELYLGLVLDRASGKVVFMASQHGGMDIEEVAHNKPGEIFKEYIDPGIWLAALPEPCKLASFKLELAEEQIADAVRFMMGLYKAFIDTDSTLMEIQPLHHHQGRQAGRARLQDQLR